ncbi:MAG: DUF2490 domain-containing protein [Candidatus Obscuribacterales bacterium]
MQATFYSVILFALALALLTPARAEAIDNAFQWWQPVYLDTALVNPRLRGYLESNPRLNDGLQGINQYLLRSALGYRIRPNLSLYQGFVLVNNWIPGYDQERRIYQQLGYGMVIGEKLQVLHRLRQEQRFLEGTNGVSNRSRYLLRLAYPLGRTYYYLTASNELFVNLNSLQGGPPAGIDQNRLYCALGRQVSRHVRAELGYQWQYINRDDKFDDKGSHILMTQVFLNF